METNSDTETILRATRWERGQGMAKKRQKNKRYKWIVAKWTWRYRV